MNIAKEKDKKRGMKLGSVDAGTGHDNFLKGIVVQFDILYDQSFTRQLQRYRFVDIVSSQSTMHKLKDMDFTRCFNKFVDVEIIKRLETIRQEYRENPSNDNFQRLVLNCPMGLEMWMGISTNYLQLKTIYKQRKKHKLEAWKIFCDWIETLPMFKELVSVL